MGGFHEILGINERNIRYIYPSNQRKYYPIADDKLISKNLLEEANIPTPKLIRSYRHFFQLRNIAGDLKGLADFVIKPARGMGGGGILLIDAFKEPGRWLTSSGRKIDGRVLYDHCAMILSGVYSIDNTSDAVMIEKKINLHESLRRIIALGIPDIRVIIYNQEPVMAMLRIPTRKSEGRANLHAGGIAVAIDVQSGITFINPGYKNSVAYNPDTGEKMTDITIPFWQDILQISIMVARLVPLRYMGIDFVLDQEDGPQILELNVRPGLEIQNINGRGLKTALEALRDRK